MIKALLLILNPAKTWDRIHLARRGLGLVLVVYLIPLLVITLAAEGYGLVQWGRWQGQFAHLKLFTAGEAVVIQVAQFIIWLVAVFVGAFLVKSMGETFHGRHSLRQSFTVTAYGLGPLFLLHLLDVAPVVSPWLSWGIGVCLCAGVLYQGLPKIMEPDPPHAFGLYLVSCILLVFISGLIRFVTAWYFKGEFLSLQRFVADLGARLHF